MTESPSPATAAAPYRVLARKYRPADFTAMIGQEAMVRTLSNAIAAGRIAQAFVLTGTRGIGKTTTARIIARALNCIGPDGKGGPTVNPCGVCDNCVAIAADRHQDVIEMDAASHNGIEGIRDLIDGVRYAPVMARYKVYILDEVHMLSTPAFNALLKTLEEPPPHVKFIFATTEIRKVPVTVLSRCQRFDLRRVDAATLVDYFAKLAAKEGATVAPDALALIARAAEGSVRDGLSLLDQAIAHGAGQVTGEQVRDMLGLADRARVVDLFEQTMQGDIAAALANLKDQYNAGADPGAILQDLLEFTHWVTRLKLVPDAASDVTATESERERGKTFAASLSMAVLSRAWAMLLKGLAEVRSAPQPVAAAEMALIRLAYAADLPSPADLVKQLQDAPRAPAPTAAMTQAAPSGGGGGGAATARQLDPRPHAPPSAPPNQPPTATLRDFQAVLDMAGEKREALLKAHLYNYAHLVSFAPGQIELRLASGAPNTVPGELARKLFEWTGQRWLISLSNEDGQPTLAQQAAASVADRKATAAADPLVQAALAAFPGAQLVAVNDLLPVLAGDDGEAIGSEEE